MQTDFDKIQQLALAVLQTEAEAIQALYSRIDEKFVKACEYLLGCKGRVVVCGMGKSGHIANKIAATLASTGTPAFFVHPAEASHGDLGMITPQDVVILLSNSGETDELLVILPLIKRLGTPLIAVVGRVDSTLAQRADVVLDVSVAKEACPLGLAPTSSTTAALAMGDALAIALLEARGFTADDFAMAHPSGALGRRLLLKVDDVMRIGEALPRVNENTVLKDALIEMSRKGLGITLVLGEQNQVKGVFTDGDLRRALESGYDIHTTCMKDLMTKGGRRIHQGVLAVEALKQMEEYRIAALLVIDDQNEVVGIVHLSDLLKAKVM